MPFRSRLLVRRFQFRRRHVHYGVFLNPERQAQIVRPQQSARFVFFVENDSLDPVMLRAEVEGLPFGWLAMLKREDPGVYADDAFQLPPKARAHYSLTIKPPKRLLEGRAEAIFTVIDVQDESMSAHAVAEVTLAGEPLPEKQRPGDPLGASTDGWSDD